MFLVVERSIGSKLGCNYHTTENFMKCLNATELNTYLFPFLAFPSSDGWIHLLISAPHIFYV